MWTSTPPTSYFTISQSIQLVLQRKNVLCKYERFSFHNYKKFFPVFPVSLQSFIQYKCTYATPSKECLFSLVLNKKTKAKSYLTQTNV